MFEGLKAFLAGFFKQSPEQDKKDIPKVSGDNTKIEGMLPKDEAVAPKSTEQATLSLSDQQKKLNQAEKEDALLNELMSHPNPIETASIIEKIPRHTINHEASSLKNAQGQPIIPPPVKAEFKAELQGRKTLSAEDLYSHTNAPKAFAPEPVAPTKLASIYESPSVPQQGGKKMAQPPSPLDEIYQRNQINNQPTQPVPQQGGKKMARPPSPLDELYQSKQANTQSAQPVPQQGGKKMAQPLSPLDELYQRNQANGQGNTVQGGASGSRLIRSTLFNQKTPEYLPNDEEEALAIKQLQYQKQRQLQVQKESGSQFTEPVIQRKNDSFQISPTAQRLAQTPASIQRPTLKQDDPLFEHMSFLNELDNDLWFVKAGQSTPQPMLKKAPPRIAQSEYHRYWGNFDVHSSPKQFYFPSILRASRKIDFLSTWWDALEVVEDEADALLLDIDDSWDDSSEEEEEEEEQVQIKGLSLLERNHTKILKNLLETKDYHELQWELQRRKDSTMIPSPMPMKSGNHFQLSSFAPVPLSAKTDIPIGVKPTSAPAAINAVNHPLKNQAVKKA